MLITPGSNEMHSENMKAPLNSTEISRVQFTSKMLNGYDDGRVDDFLDEVIETVKGYEDVVYAVKAIALADPVNVAMRILEIVNGEARQSQDTAHCFRRAPDYCGAHDRAWIPGTDHCALRNQGGDGEVGVVPDGPPRGPVLAGDSDG